MPPSRALGEVYAWEPRLGTDSFAYLFLENVVGEFKVGERVSQTDKLYGGFTGDIDGLGQILAIDTVIREGVDTYDQTTSFVVGYDGTNLFDSTSFVEDDFVVFDNGATGIANGYVMDWSVVGDGTTGQIRLLGTQGTFELGMSATYGEDDSLATISTILHTGELQYRSGEILYIQNVKPIQRARDQKEEIKIVIDF
jgi:hypothetical protein